MKHFILSIALSALVAVAVSATAQASYYHHRHHHYWHHGGGGPYWNYYRSFGGRGNSVESQR
jgi:hypothetical protein